MHTYILNMCLGGNGCRAYGAQIIFGIDPQPCRVCVRTGRETAGPSTALRSGRDDNSVAGKWSQKRSDERLPRSHRIVIPTGADPDFRYAALTSSHVCGFQ